MRNVQITRKRSFVGSLISYSIFVGSQRTEINPQNPDDIWNFPETNEIKISNGKTITISIPDGKCGLLVLANTSDSIASSHVYSIEEGTADLELELLTKYNWMHGSQYILKPVTARHSKGC